MASSPEWVQPLEIIPMSEDDIGLVAGIERNAQITPWSPDVFRDCLKAGYDCNLIRREGDVAGFIIVSRVLDEAHLLNLVVSPTMQGRGLGYEALHRVMRDLADQGMILMYLEVRASNFRARRLYESLGFRINGLRRDYYPSPAGREDAILMMAELGPGHK